jgi:hypothetical protein
MDLSHGTTFPHVDDLVFFVLCVFFLSMRPYIYIIIYLWTDKKAQNFFLVMGADAFQEVKPFQGRCLPPIPSCRRARACPPVAGAQHSWCTPPRPSVPVSIISGSRARNVNARRPDTRSRSHASLACYCVL